VSMNLRSQVLPIVSWFSSVTQGPFDRPPRAREPSLEARLTREEVLVKAREEASRRGIRAPAGGIAYAPALGFYSVGFFALGHEHGDGGLGNPWLHFDDQSGELTAAELPGHGSAGDVFMQAQYPLHSGRIGGVAGRALVSLLGVVVCGLSVTGVLLWARRRRARAWQAHGQKPQSLAHEISKCGSASPSAR